MITLLTQNKITKRGEMGFKKFSKIFHSNYAIYANKLTLVTKWASKHAIWIFAIN